MSPTDVLSVDEVPLERFHVKDVQIKRVGLHAIELSISGAYLGLPLVEVRLGPRFAIELLYLIALDIEEVAVVSFLIRCSETTEDKDMLV